MIDDLRAVVESGPWGPGIWFDALDSTNRVASERAAELPEGSIVACNHQTGGRGRLGRDWFGPPEGALTFSLLLHPRWTVDRFGLITLMASVAVCDVIAGYEVKPRIKWPNDVNIEGRKVCGILAEMVGGVDASVVLGVGLNVEVDSFPPPLDETATSLRISTGGRVSRSEVLTEFISRFRDLYERDLGEMLERYRSLCETLGSIVRVETPTGTMESLALDVDPTGGLILQSGQVLRAGDVTHVR